MKRSPTTPNGKRIDTASDRLVDKTSEKLSSQLLPKQVATKVDNLLRSTENKARETLKMKQKHRFGIVYKIITACVCVTVVVEVEGEEVGVVQNLTCQP